MYRKITAAIAATIIITAMFASFATVAGSHSHSATWEETGTKRIIMKENAVQVFWITIKNGGPDPIENVRIATPEMDPGPLAMLTEDNVMTTVVDNDIILPAGTLVQLRGTVNFTLLEGTEVLRDNGENVYVPAVDENAKLLENALLELVDNANISLEENDNVSFVKDKTLTLTGDNRLRLLEDTLVGQIMDNVVTLPENTKFEVVQDDNAEYLSLGDNVKVAEGTVLTLENRENRLKAAEDIEVARGGVYIDTIAKGTILKLAGDNNVKATKNTVLMSNDPTTAVTVWENTDVIRERFKPMLREDVPENLPEGWTQDEGNYPLLGDNFVEWTTENYAIEDGESLDFPVGLMTPPYSDNFSVYVRTTDSKGATKQSKLILEVDNIDPEVEVEASPTLVSENMDVTITITASEPLAKLENVMVAENMAPENTQVTVTPNADNTVWTGTYTTSDNKERDGEATVYVKEYEDSVGNVGPEETATFDIDRRDPPAPKLTAITGWPTDALGATAAKETNMPDWFVEGIAQDNAGVLASGTVEIRIGTTVFTETTDANGYWFENELTLSEGTREVGIKTIDKAGNKSIENAENITLDTTAPSFSISTPENDDLITDNTPMIELTISDTTIGVENAWPFDNTDNSGWIVTLCYENKEPKENLKPVMYPTEDPFNSFTFENDYDETGLADGTWTIFVQAGDNLQPDSTYFTFHIDTTVPDFDEGWLSDHSTLHRSDGTLIDPLTSAVDEKTLTMTGTAVEAGSTIKVYNQNDTLLGSVELGKGKTDWRTTITLEDCYNDIYVEETDRAGNTSEKVFFRGIVADENPPEIKLSSETAALANTETGDSSVKVKATITDTCADYKDIDVSLRSPQYDIPESYATLSPDGTIQVTMPLREGNNKIDIVAKDQVKNTAVESFIIKRTVTPWAVYAAIAAIIAIILAAIAVIRIERS